jgi:hypothetical protein
MQYVMDLRQMSSCQRHIRDGCDRFLDDAPAWTVLHQGLVIKNQQIFTISARDERGYPP